MRTEDRTSLDKTEKGRGRRSPSIVNLAIGCMMVVVAIISITAIITTSAITFHIVHGTSMAPTLNPGDLLIVARAGEGGDNAFTEIKKGDIIIFTTYDPEFYGDTISHRVMTTGYHDVTGNSPILITKGDNNEITEPLLDYPICEQDYRGKVIGKIPFIGLPNVWFTQDKQNTVDTLPTVEEMREGLARAC